MKQSSTLNLSVLMPHPLEGVEDLLIRRDLAYDRPIDDEIVAETAGQWNTLKLWYRWEESLGVLVMTCAMESKTPTAQRTRLYPLLAAMNEKLWLGHFDVSSEDGVVMFRYSLMLREGEEASPHLLEALLDVAVTECDRAYPALQAVLWGSKPVEEALSMALFETCGEA